MSRYTNSTQFLFSYRFEVLPTPKNVAADPAQIKLFQKHICNLDIAPAKQISTIQSILSQFKNNIAQEKNTERGWKFFFVFSFVRGKTAGTPSFKMCCSKYNHFWQHKTGQCTLAKNGPEMYTPIPLDKQYHYAFLVFFFFFLIVPAAQMRTTKPALPPTNPATHGGHKRSRQHLHQQLHRKKKKKSTSDSPPFHAVTCWNVSTNQSKPLLQGCFSFWWQHACTKIKMSGTSSESTKLQWARQCVGSRAKVCFQESL